MEYPWLLQIGIVMSVQVCLQNPLGWNRSENVSVHKRSWGTWKVTCDEEGKRGSRWRYPLKIMTSLMSSPLRKEPLTICASVMCNCGWKRSICAIIVQLLLHGAKNGWGGYIGGNKDLQLVLNLSFLPIHCPPKFSLKKLSTFYEMKEKNWWTIPLIVGTLEVEHIGSGRLGTLKQ